MFKNDGMLMGILNWITRLLYLQILWLFFCLIGLVIGGVFPATFTMFGIARKWIREHTDDPLFKTFWKMYKESFIQTNILGWLITLFGFSIYFYYSWASELTGIIPFILIGMLFVLGLAYIFISLFVIPVYVHFNVGLLGVIKHAVITAISYPFHAIAMMIILTIFWYILLFLPIVFLFIGVSILTYILMFIANAAFVSIEKKLAR